MRQRRLGDAHLAGQRRGTHRAGAHHPLHHLRLECIRVRHCVLPALAPWALSARQVSRGDIFPDTGGNIQVAFLAFALGLTVGVLFFANGLSLGALTWVYHFKGVADWFWAWILPHGIPEIAAICIAGGRASCSVSVSAVRTPSSVSPGGRSS
ncbi:stage II sporulation protein M [Myxococcus sp. AM009]|nr:stage II sporulation protein M [Myxococcus sp. AM009]NVJ16803.1 stage II sporulation protein M [Myxococcus sp. AM010]